MKPTFALVDDDSPDRVNSDKQAFKDIGEIGIDVVEVERLYNKTFDQTRQDIQESASVVNRTASPDDLTGLMGYQCIQSVLEKEAGRSAEWLAGLIN